MNNEIGRKIKEIRKQQKMTQAELGSLIGKKEVTIRKYENGSIEVPLNVLSVIAEKLHTSIANLIGATDTSPVEPFSDTYIQLAMTSSSLNTHPDYLLGKTYESSSIKYFSDAFLDALKSPCLDKEISSYSKDIQLSIYKMLYSYMSSSIRFSGEENKISAYSLSNLLFSTLIIKQINQYVRELNDTDIITHYPDGSIFDSGDPTIENILNISMLKTNTLNTISQLLDELTTVYLTTDDDSLFKEKIQQYFSSDV